VIRSILALELYTMAYRFDMGASIKSTLNKALNIDLPLALCTDSKSLYNYMVKLSTTSKKRLIINIIYLC